MQGGRDSRPTGEPGAASFPSRRGRFLRLLDEPRLRSRGRRGGGVPRSAADRDRDATPESTVRESPPGARGGTAPRSLADGGGPDAASPRGAGAREIPPPRGASLPEGLQGPDPEAAPGYLEAALTALDA